MEDLRDYPLVVRSEEKVHPARMKLAPSYVVLLTCLEIAKQAKKLPKEPGLGTTGQR
ncbi:MAG TPA: hypothetical protein VIY07_16215 [Pseudolabrys sp.]